MWPHDEPAVWWPTFFSRQLEQVVSEIFGHFVVVDNGVELGLAFEGAFEEVQRTVIFVVDQVFEVVLEGNSQFVPIIVLSDLELHVLVLS